MMLAVFQLFMPNQGQVWLRPVYSVLVDDVHMNWLHLGLWSFMLSVAITMMLIPYYAWGSELSTDYHERSKVTGSRAVFNSLGSLSAQLIPALALLIFGIGGSSVVLQLVGLTMLILMPLCVSLTLFNVAEQPYQPRQQVKIMEGLRLMAANGPFKRLVLAFMIGSLGLNVTTPLYLFFIADVLNAEDKAIYMLSFFYAASILAVPFWVALSKRIGKHRAYLISFFMLAFASFGGAIALFGLSLVGFEAGVENGSDELFGLRFLFSTFPSLFFLAGAAIVWNYPITEARHAEIRAELEAKAT
jgi:Na+/melibiose symporter-like transporter